IRGACGSDHLIDICFGGNIRDTASHPCPLILKGGNNIVEGLFYDIHDNDRGSLRYKALDDGSTNARSAPCHERNLIVKTHKLLLRTIFILLDTLRSPDKLYPENRAYAGAVRSSLKRGL